MFNSGSQALDGGFSLLWCRRFNFVRHLSLSTCLCLIELKKSTGFVICFLVMVRMYTPLSKKNICHPSYEC